MTTEQTAPAEADEGNGEEWALYITEAVLGIASARGLLDARVIEARNAGCSWAIIARGTGTSRQACMQKFGNLVD